MVGSIAIFAIQTDSVLLCVHEAPSLFESVLYFDGSWRSRIALHRSLQTPIAHTTRHALLYIRLQKILIGFLLFKFVWRVPLGWIGYIEVALSKHANCQERRELSLVD